MLRGDQADLTVRDGDGADVEVGRRCRVRTDEPTREPHQRCLDPRRAEARFRQVDILSKIAQGEESRGVMTLDQTVSPGLERGNGPVEDPEDILRVQAHLLACRLKFGSSHDHPTRLFNSVILSSCAMTKRLDRLEEMHLVERLPDPNDRRGRLVVLTDRGRELVDAAVAEHLENEQTLLSALDAREREQLAGLLRKLLLSPPFRELDPAPGSADPEA